MNTKGGVTLKPKRVLSISCKENLNKKIYHNKYYVTLYENSWTAKIGNGTLLNNYNGIICIQME